MCPHSHLCVFVCVYVFVPLQCEAITWGCFVDGQHSLAPTQEYVDPNEKLA